MDDSVIAVVKAMTEYNLWTDCFCLWTRAITVGDVCLCSDSIGRRGRRSGDHCM